MLTPVSVVVMGGLWRLGSLGRGGQLDVEVAAGHSFRRGQGEGAPVEHVAARARNPAPSASTDSIASVTWLLVSRIVSSPARVHRPWA
jgi:hypothetical protein